MKLTVDGAHLSIDLDAGETELLRAFRRPLIEAMIKADRLNERSIKFNQTPGTEICRTTVRFVGWTAEEIEAIFTKVQEELARAQLVEDEDFEDDADW